MVALLLVRDHGNRLAGAQSSGWLRRTERLLQDEPESLEYGYLQMMRARNGPQLRPVRRRGGNSPRKPR